MLIYSFTLFINLFKDRSLFIGGSCRIRSPIDYPSAAGVAGTASHQYPLRNWENPPDFRPNIYVYIYVYAYMYMYIHKHTHIYIVLFLYLWIFICIYIYIE